jgi:hypothetical protein
MGERKGDGKTARMGDYTDTQGKRRPCDRLTSYI